METVSAAQDDSSGANPSSVKSDDSSPRHEGGRGSPPPHCAICLGTCRNKSFTDSCLHQFCFKCLLTWSKVKAECPLCKQNFRSIIHNVRSNHQYDEYTVEQRVEETTHSIDIDSLTNATRRFRYRTTLTLPRRETLAIQQLLLHYPLFPPRAPPTRRRREPAAFRRTVYRHNLWARPLPDFTGRFRDCTPDFYRYNESQMHRLLPWINRELHYLLNENVGHIAYVMTRIQELLPQYHINSPEFREAMHRYFGDRTEHFLHELFCFASTPYDMNGYDRNVQYTTDSRVSTMVNEVISSSESEASVDSDIVMVSHSEPTDPPPGPSRVPAPVYPDHYLPAPPPADNVIPIETISQSDSDDDSSEVMVVGYIKPPQDRTPEVVDLLGSDSDVIVQDGAQDAAAEPSPPPPSAPLVKLSLKRQRRASDSSGDLWTVMPRRRRPHSATTSDTSRDTPSPPPHHSCPPSSSASSFAVTTTTTTTTTTTSTTSSSSSSDSDSDSFVSPSPTSSSSSGRRRRLTRKKAKRKSRRSKPVERSRRRGRRGESPRRRERRSPSRTESRDRRSKRKSHSGKGVKSSKRPAPVPAADVATAPSSRTPPPTERDRTPPRTDPSRTPCTSSTLAASPEPARTPPLAEPARTPPLPDDRPGPSDHSQFKSGRSRKRRRASHESRRLKSVVNVMYRNSGDSNSGCSSLGVNGNPSSEYSAKESIGDETIRKRAKTSMISPSSFSSVITPRVSDDDTDSEDNLPLNLSVQKTFHSL